MLKSNRSQKARTRKFPNNVLKAYFFIIVKTRREGRTCFVFGGKSGEIAINWWQDTSAVPSVHQQLTFLSDSVNVTLKGQGHRYFPALVFKGLANNRQCYCSSHVRIAGT